MKPLEHKRILVVDDEELLREILIEDLAHYGAEVVEAGNGNAALELLKSHKYDIVITDVRMPGGNGIDLIKNINKMFAKDKPKIFLCSGYNDISEIEIEGLGVTFTFSKPFNRENFIQIITKSLTSA